MGWVPPSLTEWQDISLLEAPCRRERLFQVAVLATAAAASVVALAFAFAR